MVQIVAPGQQPEGEQKQAVAEQYREIVDHAALSPCLPLRSGA
jgi:hypothetical protein